MEPDCDERQFVLKSGKCEDCESFTTIGDDSNKVCIKPKCDEREIITEDGECEYCDDYFKISKDKKECNEVQCDGR